MFKNIIATGVLIGAVTLMLNLGFWQLDRLEWKNDILSKIEKYESLDATKTPLDLSNTEDFQRGYIEGRFLNKPAVQIKPRTNTDGAVGYHLLYPFKTNDGQNIIVNMGWRDGETYPIPTSRKITGYLRSPDKQSSFTPQNKPEKNQFYSIDMNDLETFYNLKLNSKILYLDNAFSTMQKPRNKHAQYVAFWFGMSGLLILLSCLYLWRARRQAS